MSRRAAEKAGGTCFSESQLGWEIEIVAHKDFKPGYGGCTVYLRQCEYSDEWLTEKKWHEQQFSLNERETSAMIDTMIEGLSPTEDWWGYLNEAKIRGLRDQLDTAIKEKEDWRKRNG